MDSLLSLLSGAVQFIGGGLIVLGLVNIGLTLKDSAAGGGGQLSGGVAMVVAGALIAAVARAVTAA